jgi:hypothetical protein
MQIQQKVEMFYSNCVNNPNTGCVIEINLRCFVARSVKLLIYMRDMGLVLGTAAGLSEKHIKMF